MKINITLVFLSLCSSVQANMIVDMGVMLGGQMGASMANQSISAMYKNMGDHIAQDQKNILTNNTDFQAYVAKAGKAELKNIFKNFKTAQKHMGTLTTEQSAFMNQMETYIMQAISLDPPQSDYISQGPTSDQQFTQGTMYTPVGQIWKNVFPLGNWEYDENTDSFWQMYNAPLMTTTTDPNTGAVTTSADTAPNNSIFTEWITRQSSYEILCEVTLYQVSYPFFVGIIFNKARWISGDNNRLQNYRLLGLYGDDNKTIQVRYAEQYISAAAAASTTPPTTLYPLQQILKTSPSTAPQIAINQKVFPTLSLQPVTFKIKVITSPGTIAYKVWQVTKTSQEPANFVTVKSKDNTLYLYHDIGFMAPGAMAQFKIIKPTEILFSPSAQQTFKAEVKTLLTKELLAKGTTS